MTTEYPVTEERWRRFLKDGDDEIFHKTVFNSCGGKFRFDPKILPIVPAECQKCGFSHWTFGPWMKDTIYAITPEREPRYKLVEITAGKNRFTTLVPQP